MRWSLAWVLLLLPLAGCVEPGTEVQDLDAVEPPRAVVPPDARPAEVVPDEPTASVARLPAVGFDAPVSVGAPVYVSGACPGRCVLPVQVPALEGTALLEVVVSWDGTQTVVRPTLEGAVRGFDSLRWLLAGEGPVDVGLVGDGAVDVRVRVLGPDVDYLSGDAMLPNIVTYAPVQVAFGACDQVEQNEQGATRCLRLGNAIGNVGDGPLQVALPFEQGALTPAGLGSFDQVVLLRGGGEDRHTVGNADFHPTHAHFHYDGFARFSLFEWDEETGLRGELAAEHKKSGFCFLDWGEMDEPDRAPRDTDHAEDDCLVPGGSGWTMGVTAGWFDFYWSSLTDQYVDAAGVPDGTYELVSTADWNDGLLETDEADNSASAVLRIEGDTVTVLEARSFYTLPEDTRNL